MFYPCYTCDIQKEGLKKEGFKMVDQRDKTISVRVSEEEKDLIQQLAEEEEETLTGYIRGVVFPEERLKEDTENEEEVSEQLTAKDKEIDEKNKEIAALRVTLEEQQKIALTSKQTKQKLHEEVNDQQEKTREIEKKEKKSSQQFSILLILFLLAIGVIVFGNEK